MRYRHLKSGRVYDVTSTQAHIEKEGLEGEPQVVYTDGVRTWIRPYREFFDGRFEKMQDEFDNRIGQVKYCFLCEEREALCTCVRCQACNGLGESGGDECIPCGGAGAE